jgi:hypothetical protein
MAERRTQENERAIEKIGRGEQPGDVGYPSDPEDATPLAADRTDEAHVREDADTLADVDALPVLDEDIESAAPDVLEVSTPSGDDLELQVRAFDEEPDPQREERGPSRRRALEGQPETQGENLDEVDTEGRIPG